MKSAILVTGNAMVGGMPDERVRKRGRGRPNKGERYPFNVKLPIQAAEKTQQLAKLYGVGAAPLIAERFCEWLSTVDLDELQAQERWPMTG